MAGAGGDDSFFEGTEKLLEVWFSSSDEDGAHDLRTVKRLVFMMFLVLSV